MTRQVVVLSSRDARRVPWRNGRGFTEELAIWPERASFERGDFDWRVSKARVDEAGPFSSFPGFERVLVVTDGDGVELDHGDAAPRAFVRRLEPYRFSGDWPTSARLPRGPIADFNVLARSDAFAVEVDVVRLGRRRALVACGRSHTFVHALEGDSIVRVPNEDEPFELAAGDSVWAIDVGADEEVELAGGSDRAIAVVVRVTAAADLRRG